MAMHVRGGGPAQGRATAALIALLLVAACVKVPARSTGRVDAMPPKLLCTTPACDVDPCADDCDGALSGEVNSDEVQRCPGFCGFLNYPSGLLVGCASYRYDVCPTDCHARWGDPDCIEHGPDVDYETGGAICRPELSCFTGE